MTMSKRDAQLRLLFVLAPILATAVALADYLPDRVRADEGASYPDALLFSGGLSLLIQLAAGVRQWRRSGGFDALSRLGAIAGIAIVVLVTLLATTFAEWSGLIGGDRVALRTFATFAGAASAALYFLFGVEGRFDHVAVKPVAMLSASTLFCLVLLEALLVAWNFITPIPLLIGESGARETLERYRMEGGSPHRGGILNSEGYFDEPFVASRSPGSVGVVLADSFGIGIVPRGVNFIDVAEASLGDALGRSLWLDNRGIPAIGIPEYAWILENEIAKDSIRTVVVCLFPTNDLWSVRDRRRPRASISNWLLRDVTAGAIARLRLSLASGQDTLSPLLDEPAVGTGIADSALAVLPPTFPEDEYLRIEGDRLRAVDPSGRSIANQLERTIEVLNAMRSRTNAPLRVVLIPDEFQVSDSLHAEVVARFPRYKDIDRNATYQKLKRLLKDEEYKVLDLLDLLREGERLGATYHPRDTHWNAHGNRIAGEALARFLEPDFSGDP
jgi:hypothetical protein